MHSTDWSRLLTERQREVLSIVVENKVYRNRDSKISELADQVGIAPAAVAKRLLEIEKEALLQVVGTPSEQGKRLYERMELEPRPEKRPISEVLDPHKIAILHFLRDHPDASATEIVEEMGLSEYTTVNSLRVLTAVQLVTKQRGPALHRGVPPYVYRATAHGEDLAARGGCEVRRPERELVLHHAASRVRNRPTRLRPLDRGGGRGRRGGPADVGTGDRDLPARRRLADRGERRIHGRADRHRCGRPCEPHRPTGGPCAETREDRRLRISFPPRGRADPRSGFLPPVRESGVRRRLRLDLPEGRGRERWSGRPDRRTRRDGGLLPEIRDRHRAPEANDRRLDSVPVRSVGPGDARPGG